MQLTVLENGFWSALSVMLWCILWSLHLNQDQFLWFFYLNQSKKTVSWLIFIINSVKINEPLAELAQHAQSIMVVFQMSFLDFLVKLLILPNFSWFWTALFFCIDSFVYFVLRAGSAQLLPIFAVLKCSSLYWHHLWCLEQKCS